MASVFHRPIRIHPVPGQSGSKGMGLRVGEPFRSGGASLYRLNPLERRCRSPPPKTKIQASPDLTERTLVADTGKPSGWLTGGVWGTTGLDACSGYLQDDGGFIHYATKRRRGSASVWNRGASTFDR